MLINLIMSGATKEELIFLIAANVLVSLPPGQIVQNVIIIKSN